MQQTTPQETAAAAANGEEKTRFRRGSSGARERDVTPDNQPPGRRVCRRSK
jgi:hypothetical protein